MLRQHTWLSIGLVILLLLSSGKAMAQTAVDRWLRYDITLNVQQNSTIAVEEVHEVALVSGATTFTRIIPTDKLENIGNLQVLQINANNSQRSYQLGENGANYTFQVTPEENQQTVTLHFPANNVPSTKFVLRYIVNGAIRFYPEGDRLDWQPFGETTTAPIASSTIVVNLPSAVPQEQMSLDSAGVATNKYFPAAGKMIFTTAEIPANEELEISARFPSGVVQGTPPRWQQEADAFQAWTPILQWGSVILGLLFLVLSPLAVYGWWWYTQVRTPAGAGKAPKYLKSPPSELSPATAGTLLEGKVNPNHLLATLLDMAQRGVLNIGSNQGNNPAPNEKKRVTFTLYPVDQNRASRPYEGALCGKIFGLGNAPRPLDDIQETLAKATPPLKQQINAEVTKTGYMHTGPNVIRRQYTAFGGAGIALSAVLALLAAVFLGRFTYLIVCPFLGLAMGAVALIVAGFFASSRTEAGAKEAVRWEAFKRYLKDLGPKEAAKAKSRFEQLLPYAVAFGVEKGFIEKFAAVDTPAPKWWGQPERKSAEIDTWDSISSGSERSNPIKQPGTKSVIRRLGQPAVTPPPQSSLLLKQIQPALLLLLNTGNEVFSKAPLPEQEGDS